MKSLSNQIIIAMPHMLDDRFKKSVILIFEHNKLLANKILNFDESQYTDEFIKNLYNKEFFQRNYRDKRHNNLNMARILYEYFTRSNGRR